MSIHSHLNGMVKAVSHSPVNSHCAAVQTLTEAALGVAGLGPSLWLPSGLFTLTYQRAANMERLLYRQQL